MLLIETCDAGQRPVSVTMSTARDGQVTVRVYKPATPKPASALVAGDLMASFVMSKANAAEFKRNL